MSYLYWNTKGFSGKTEPKVFIYFQFIGREMKTEQNEKVKKKQKIKSLWFTYSSCGCG